MCSKKKPCEGLQPSQGYGNRSIFVFLFYQRKELILFAHYLAPYLRNELPCSLHMPKFHMCLAHA